MPPFGKRLFYSFRHKFEFFDGLFEDQTTRRLRNRHKSKFIWEGFFWLTCVNYSVIIFLAWWERHKIEEQWEKTPGSFPVHDYPELYTPYVRDEFKHLYFPGGLNEEDLVVSMEVHRDKVKTLKEVQKEKQKSIDKFKKLGITDTKVEE
ncbi:hypothetical protein ABK040_010336 [Willaertia magna]